MESNIATEVDIQEIFKTHLKIESKVMSIETLFSSERRAGKTNFSPEYQRNYVWDDDKATYFIESILLGTEIPPIIFFVSEDKIEVIDGRQRYETIKRFLSKKFKLRKKGLLKLKDLRNRNFDDLPGLQDTFWDTKLRIIEFSFRDQSTATPEREDIVKKEIFKRYNSGITPLKSVEIDKAKYQKNHINRYFKKRISANVNVQKDIQEIFYPDQQFDVEKVLKRIRQQLVLTQIPIHYYSNTNAKQQTIERYFNYLSSTIEEAEPLYIDFLKKLSFLKEMKAYFDKKGLSASRLVFEGLFWAISIIENEGISYDIMLNEDNKAKIYDVLINNTESFKIEHTNFYKKIFERYDVIAKLFEQMTGISFGLYLANSESFKEKNRQLSQVATTDTSSLSVFESLRLNKPDASSNPIDDICSRMSKERFLVRPSYQRKEVIDRLKSSAIIESILLGIKLPPIFVYKRNDGVAEVLDGQQRLLSILGYLGKSFLDENRKIMKSEKNKFQLKKLNILDNLEGKRFNSLSAKDQNKILDFDLWIIEISEKNNPHFDPIDLFIRLNYKPYPILENTFEMWNSYVDRGIIDKIREIHSRHSDWFYVRRDNRRMNNESLLTYLAFLEFRTTTSNGWREAPSVFDIYKIGSKINIRVISKHEISKILDVASNKQGFIYSCEHLESDFILKVKSLVSDSHDDSSASLKQALDNILAVLKFRSFQNFYALWYILLNIPIESIEKDKKEIRLDVNKLFEGMRNKVTVDAFKNDVKKIQEKYR